ncbi:MAG: ribbon-helix-helix domain-containing protein [Isosphaeraceae bacterium]
MMKKGELARTSVFLRSDQLARLRAISEESGIPLAVMIRRGVSRYLDDWPGTSVVGIRPRGGQSEPAAEENPARAEVACPLT